MDFQAAVGGYCTIWVKGVEERDPSSFTDYCYPVEWCRQTQKAHLEMYLVEAGTSQGWVECLCLPDFQNTIL
jgi:hypothetical protein